MKLEQRGNKLVDKVAAIRRSNKTNGGTSRETRQQQIKYQTDRQTSGETCKEIATDKPPITQTNKCRNKQGDRQTSKETNGEI